MSENSGASMSDESVDLFSLLRRLERAKPHLPRIGESSTRKQDIAILGQPAYVDHSVQNVDEVKGGAQPRVLSRFMGLLGPQGALPLHTSYEAVHWQNMRDEAFVRFLDIFNNRFQQLFYRAWANARPIVQADRPSDNQFRSYLGSSLGIGTMALRQRDRLNDYTKMALAGLLAPAAKSASRLEHMLTWLFKARVNVQQFLGVWLPLEQSERAVLQRGSCSLGVDSIIGKSAFSVSDKFRIRFEARDLKEFESLLPDGQHFRLMSDAVRFYLGETFIYDVEVGLPERHAPPVSLGKTGRLGWTSWVKRPPSTETTDVIRWDCRYYPNEIIAHEEKRQLREQDNGRR